MEENESIQIKPNVFVQPIRNNHVAADSFTYKSFGYQVYQTKSKLKEEYAKLPQQQINHLLNELGKEKMSETIRISLLAYSGDTPVDNYEKWNNTKILIHEATFLEKAELDKLNIRGNKHSSLDEVLKMVADLNVETLILGHFSSRYSGEQINDRIKLLCNEYKIKIPVYSILPGINYRDILKNNPVNK